MGEAAVIWGRLTEAFWLNCQLFGLTLLFALPLGLVVSFGSMSRLAPLRGVVKTFVWVIRGTPVLVQLFVVFYGLPGVGVRLRCVATDEEYFYPSSKMSVNSVNRLCFPTDIDFTPCEWEAIIGSQYTPTYHLYKKERYGYLTFTVV